MRTRMKKKRKKKKPFNCSSPHLVIGKIALVISAIIGLKKLVAPEGHEKTTYEIVKHPHVQQSHSYSSSHGEYDGHEGTGQYHRSFGEYEEMLNSPVFRKSS